MRLTGTALAGIAVAGLFNAGILIPVVSAAQNDQNSSSATSSQRDANTNESSQSSSRQMSQNNLNAPKGWVMVEEETVVLTANEPQNHFMRAERLLSRNDDRAAASEIRIGAAYLDMQASRKAGGADQQLKQASNDLRQLAREISSKLPNERSGQSSQQNEQQSSQQQGSQQASRENGQQTSNGQQLQQRAKECFARATKALAEHFQTLAQQEVKSQEPIMAGHDLNAAAESLSAAYAWSDQQQPQEARTAIQDARRVATQLMAPEETAENNNASAGEAQQAGARMSQQGEIPSNAQQTVTQLQNAIQQAKFNNASGQGSQSLQSQSRQQNSGTK